MSRSVRARVVGVSAVMLIAGCTSGNDAVTSPTESVGSVPVVATPSESAVPVEAPTPDATVTASTALPGSTMSDADADADADADDIVTKDVRTRSDDAVGDGIHPEGFSTVIAMVTSADGDVCTVCLWLADISDERARGLMGVTDLGDAVGMAFAYDEPGEGGFHMIGTPTPLSIGWFDAGGGLVSTADMEPCVESDSSRCERYLAEGPYTVAIEMFQGELDAIGIGAGSTVELLPGTESTDCGALG